MDVSTILDTIKLKKQELESEFSASGQLGSEGFVSEQRYVKNLDTQVVELYRGVGKVLSRYRSGMLPKAFKIIPTLTNWEQILELTSPNSWTAASMFEATKLFSSNLKDEMAQRFFNIILLPRLRDDINEYKKLNFHMYNALKRALYKPAAFFKGIILPLCEDPETTTREAVIISSVLKKTHVPMLHSAAALLKIAEMTYNPARGVFMLDLLSKNYALPYRVLDALVDHFIRYTHNSHVELNVQWHQILLKFCQLYTRDIASEQREALLDLIKHHTHAQISPAIRQILLKTPSRDTELTPEEIAARQAAADAEHAERIDVEEEDDQDVDDDDDDDEDFDEEDD